MAAHPHLYLPRCGKNGKASNRLNEESHEDYMKYKKDCNTAQENKVPAKDITVKSTPDLMKRAIIELKQARKKWKNCKEGRENFRKKCINPNHRNDGHAHPIKIAGDKMVDLQNRITKFENALNQNSNNQRAVQFENNAATTAAADEINIEDLYDIKDNKLELNRELTNGKSKAILRVYIEKIIREAAVQGLPPILSPDELNDVTVRDHGDAYKNLIRKMLIRKIILEEFGTYSMAREHLDNERGASGGGIAGFRGLSAGVIDGAMPPPLDLMSLAWHPPPPATATPRTRRRHRRTRNKRRAERAFEWTRDVNAFSDNESGRGSSRSSRSSQSSTRRNSRSSSQSSTRRNSRSRSRSTAPSTRRNSSTRRSRSRSTRRSSSRGAAENG